jgi:hypothetical protein
MNSTEYKWISAPTNVITKQNIRDNASTEKAIFAEKPPVVSQFQIVTVYEPFWGVEEIKLIPAIIVIMAESETDPTPRNATTLLERVLPKRIIISELKSGIAGIN